MVIILLLIPLLLYPINKSFTKKVISTKPNPKTTAQPQTNNELPISALVNLSDDFTIADIIKLGGSN